MPDGSQQPPVDPAAERAQQQMRDWREKHREDGGGLWASIGATVGDFVAAAETGAFAVSPDTGAAIIKQLTDVQDRVGEIQRTGMMGATLGGQRLGGGYATDIATFNQQVMQEGPGTMLKQFAEELEQLKTAVSKSIGNYASTDGTARRQVDSAGGGV
jgi:hypothetical protein